MINKQFRVAVWAMIAAFGLLVLLILPDPRTARSRIVAAREQRSAASDAAARLADVAPPGAGSAPELSIEPAPPRVASAVSPRVADVSAQPARNEREPGAEVRLGPLVEESDTGGGRWGAAERESYFAPDPRTPGFHLPRDDGRQGPIEPGPAIDLDFQSPALPLAPERRSVRFEPLAEPDASISPRTAPLEARLTGLERELERIAQQKSGDDVLRRANDLLQQLEQQNRLQELEQKLHQFQSGRAGAGGTAAAQSFPAQVPGLQPPQPAPVEPALPAIPAGPASGKVPVLRVEPSRSAAEKFSLQIADAEIGQVLEMLGEMAGKNILASPEVRGKVSVNLIDVSVDEALAGILRARGFVHEQDERFVYVMTQAEAAARRLAQRKLITKIYRPHYISTFDLQALVVPLLTPEIGKVAVTNPNEAGIPSDNEQAGGDKLAQQDALLVQDYPEVIQTIDGVFQELDVPPMQVVIEAMILSVRLTDQMQFGVNFALLNGQSDNLIVSGNGSLVQNGSGFPGGGNDSIIPPLGQLVANTAGLKYGFVAGDVAGFLNALENITDTDLIAAPQLRVLNKQRAQLIIGKRLSYTTRTFNNNQTIENVNFLDAGTKLIIRPFIGPDGLIRMEIHPERSSATINPQTNLPDLDTTEVTTNVMVRDSTTVVIGGLIEETAVASYDQVPLLGSLPVVKHLFRNKNERIDRSELIVLITPRIVREPEAAEVGAAAAVENQHRHEYFTNNLSPINRQNLARLHYERAVHFFDRGNLERAAHHIDGSLELAKNNLQAHRLQARIQEAQRARVRPWAAGADPPPAGHPLPGPACEPPPPQSPNPQSPWQSRSPAPGAAGAPPVSSGPSPGLR
ncbi:MAG: hypothetical protein WD069_11260 [Planctomycetales bacterium]